MTTGVAAASGRRSLSTRLSFFIYLFEFFWSIKEKNPPWEHGVLVPLSWLECCVSATTRHWYSDQAVSKIAGGEGRGWVRRAECAGSEILRWHACARECATVSLWRSPNRLSLDANRQLQRGRERAGEGAGRPDGRMHAVQQEELDGVLRGET